MPPSGGPAAAHHQPNPTHGSSHPLPRRAQDEAPSSATAAGPAPAAADDEESRQKRIRALQKKHRQVVQLKEKAAKEG